VENIREKNKYKIEGKGYFHAKPVFDENEFVFIFGVTQKRITVYTLNFQKIFILALSIHDNFQNIFTFLDIWRHL